MGTQNFLLIPHLLLFSTTLVICSTWARDYDNYIIHMDLASMPKAFSSHQHWYKATLSSALDNNENNNPNIPSNRLIYTYKNVMNGFSASLSPKEMESIKNTPGYISSTSDTPATLHTTHSPQFLGLNPYFGAWHDSEFGEDVIIGVVDTGVWPESESYNDSGMNMVPSRWRGQCEDSIHFNASLCNNKLIGAKFFNKGLIANNPNITINLNSTRDVEGHGTHTSSTAAGSAVDDASYFGYATGTARGVAPKAHVAMYKALWEDGAYSSDIIAAMDAAIEDGVDVLSLSFGFDERPLNTDPVATAAFAATEKGIFVAASGGNQGPSLRTLHNGTPWVTTVAATTQDREFHGTLILGNGVPIRGMSLYVRDTFPSNSRLMAPMVFMGPCSNIKEISKAREKIVVCEEDRDVDLATQVYVLETVRVSGGVFIRRPNSSDSMLFLQNRFPSMIISEPLSAKIVKEYTKGNPEARAKMRFKGTVIGTRAPSVDGYSSRGPSYSSPMVLKPDISAPGTLILAAWPHKTPVLEFGPHNKLFSKFNILSGTSMACPHIAGVAALLRGANPDWSPAIIRSAMMTTSDVFDNASEKIKDIGNGLRAATPLAMGSGQVNPNRALHPGLVYDAKVQDYVNFLCALGLHQKEIQAITRTSYNDCSNPSLDLNYPSFIALYEPRGSSSSDESVTRQEFQRTVTNVGEIGVAVYVANVTPIKGFNVSVIPNMLVFKDKNQKLSYKLRIEGPKSMNNKIDFGFLTWTDGIHVVRSPIVLTTIKIVH